VERPVDILICATGFDTSYKPRFPIIGDNGKSLSEVWADEAQSYLGMAAAGFPNYFMFAGPNTPIGNGPVLIGLGAHPSSRALNISDFIISQRHKLTTC